MDAAREIENLLYTYADRIDRGDFDGVADLFTHGRIAPSEDATIDQMVVGTSPERFISSCPIEPSKRVILAICATPHNTVPQG